VVKSETKLKQNNFTETKRCLPFVLFHFYFSFVLDVTTLRDMSVWKVAKVRDCDGTRVGHRIFGVGVETIFLKRCQNQCEDL